VIVADASVILDVLLRTRAAPRIESRLFDSNESIHVPHLLDVEVAQVLRRYVRRGEIQSHRGEHALELLRRFPMARYPHEPLLQRVWSLRANLTAYDAVYVALAEGLRATLLTRDQGMGTAAGHHATIELL
jgi:predicted nucleic acid-binding protein